MSTIVIEILVGLFMGFFVGLGFWAALVLLCYFLGLHRFIK